MERARRLAPAVTALDFSGYLSELSAIWSPTRRAISTVKYSCPVAASITDSVAPEE